MHKDYIISFIFCTLISSSVFAADTSKFESYIPTGWKLLNIIKGDLNSDGKEDAVLVLEKNDSANRKQNYELGFSELNLNPRRLLILFQKKGGYQNVLSTDKFLPTKNNEECTCLADPLEDDGITISKGVLKITLDHWTSCGGWETSSEEYLFRYKNSRFRLIGHNYHSFMRNTGKGSKFSANYLTGKIKIIEGMNEFDKKTSKTKIVWKKIKNHNLKYLDELTHLDEVTDSSLLEEHY